MSRNRKIFSLFFALIAVVLVQISGCKKDTTIVIPKVTVITGPVSFTKDIIPIFTASCTATGCHNSGGKKPDLTASQAYNSLINGNYINKIDPKKSNIYLWLDGTRSPAMPIGAPSNPSSINELVLAWIEQGAEKN